MRTILLACLVSMPALGQLLSDPPPIIQLVRKPGTGGASLKPYANAGAEVNVLGITSVTGLPETWLVEEHYSFASIEDLDKRVAALSPVRNFPDPQDPLQDDVLAPSRTMMALYRPGLSYRSDMAIRLFPRARYFQISIFRIRPGTEASFADLIRLRRATAVVINLDRPELAYQVVSGAPSGTYCFLAPIQSLRSMDDGRNALPVYAEGLAAARATDAPKMAYDAEVSRESLLFRVEPRISYVSTEFADVDPDFWRPKKK